MNRDRDANFAPAAGRALEPWVYALVLTGVPPNAADDPEPEPIPESAKPGIYDRIRRVISAPSMTAALAGAVVLAVLVNVVELLCTAGLPALYTQILMYREYPPWKNYAYLGLSNLCYMFDDAIMVPAAVSTLSHRRLQEREGRWLKLFSGLVILVLGLLLLFRPEWLV
jgi:hypothetical protein